MAIAFVIIIRGNRRDHWTAHDGQLESPLPAADAVMDEGLRDRIDEIVPPGTNINPADDGLGAGPTRPLKPAARRR